MFISEIPVGAGLRLTVGIGLQTIEFATKVAEVYDECIYAEPILQNSKMLGFGSKGLVLTMIITASDEGKAWQFSNIKVRNVKKHDGGLFHEITCKTEGKPINRRGAVRVWIGEPGMASVGISRDVFDVIVKDISVNGIAFICDNNIEISAGSVVNVTFKDPTSNTRFEISSIVVRSEEMEKNRTLYGCKLNQENTAISRYVNEKQREKLKAARQVGRRASTSGH